MDFFSAIPLKLSTQFLQYFFVNSIVGSFGNPLRMSFCNAFKNFFCNFIEISSVIPLYYIVFILNSPETASTFPSGNPSTISLKISSKICLQIASIILINLFGNSFRKFLNKFLPIVALFFFKFHKQLLR